MPAKHFLAVVDMNYYSALSAASQKSLELQGRPFEVEELERFSADPLSAEMVRLRQWDDATRVEGIEEEMPRKGECAGMIEEHLMEQLGVGC